MSLDQIGGLEELIGEALLELGYGLTSDRRMSLRSARLRATYLALFRAKHWMKATPLGRLVHLRNLEVEPNQPS